MSTQGPTEGIVESRREIVFPNDANHLGTLFGGKALAMMDITASIAALRTCRKPVVTASIDRTDFKQPVYVGEFAEVIARVVKIGRTSVQIEVELWAENPLTGDRRLSTVGKFTMVALGPDGKPTPIRPDPSTSSG
jgi:acyl-CoA hydrolase